MSSLRNAVQRRNHKERAQPQGREKWGILEKPKDYKLRAADHKSKQKRLKLLSQKARERNPDEFSFAMMKASVDQHGRRVSKRSGDNGGLSVEVVKLLKTQDAGYLRTMLQKTRREREEFEQMWQGTELESAPAGEAREDGDEGLEDERSEQVVRSSAVRDRLGARHTVFVGTREEQKTLSAEQWFNTDHEGITRRWDRPRRQSVPTEAAEQDGGNTTLVKGRTRSQKQIDAEQQAIKSARANDKRRELYRETRKVRLDTLKTRERDLQTALEQLDMQRVRMNNQVGGVNKQGVKFKIRERKR